MNLNVLHVLEQIWCISVKVEIELFYFFLEITNGIWKQPFVKTITRSFCWLLFTWFVCWCLTSETYIQLHINPMAKHSCLCCKTCFFLITFLKKNYRNMWLRRHSCAVQSAIASSYSCSGFCFAFCFVWEGRGRRVCTSSLHWSFSERITLQAVQTLPVLKMNFSMTIPCVFILVTRLTPF